jgi:hypothetical protein
MFFRLYFPFLILSAVCFAQSVDLPSRSPFSELDLATSSRIVEDAHARSAEVAFEEAQFVKRVNRVVAEWAKMAQEYNQKHALNVKNARAVSEAFRKLNAETAGRSPPRSDKASQTAHAIVM